MGLKDVAAGVVIGGAAVAGLAGATPPNTGQLADSKEISQTRNEPSTPDKSVSNQPTTGGKK